MATEATKTPEKRKITMSDGRVVEFGQKQRLVKTSNIADDGTITGRFDLDNGKTIDFTVPSSLLSRFAEHGMLQKIGDSIAGEKDTDDAFESMSDLVKRLSNGEWTQARQAGGFSGVSILIQALVEASGKSVEEIKAFLENKSQAEKLALRKSNTLAPIITRLEAEKAAKSTKTPAIDGDALLAEIGGSAPQADTPSKKSKAA
jgi:hypothetical protein